MNHINKLNKKYLIGTFIVFSIIYFTLDYLNMPYAKMIEEYSLALVILNIFLNLIMAFLSAYMISLSEYALKEKNVKTYGDNFGILSVIFGVLTYGCTPCVISFFAVFGISFSVAVLPFAGLMYKFVSLALILLGIWILFRELKRKSCKI